jgi:hypothetical protein
MQGADTLLPATVRLFPIDANVRAFSHSRTRVSKETPQHENPYISHTYLHFLSLWFYCFPSSTMPTFTAMITSRQISVSSIIPPCLIVAPKDTQPNRLRLLSDRFGVSLHYHSFRLLAYYCPYANT